MRLSDRILDSEWLESLMNWALIAMLALLAVMIMVIAGWGLIALFSPSDPTVVLHTDYWQCTASHQSLERVRHGAKIIYYTEEVVTHCDKWERKP